MKADIPLFSYGTLQMREVQLANYGRALEGSPDVLAGYEMVVLPDRDPEAVRISGTKTHMVVQPTGDPADRVPGVVFLLTAEELAATDRYEGTDYGREELVLESGQRALVYVEASMGKLPSKESLADRREAQREILLRFVERQMETGKWLLASLLVVNGGAVVALLSNESFGAQALSSSGAYFVAGVIFAFLAGAASWEFSNQVIYQLRKRLDVAVFDDEELATEDGKTKLPPTLPIFFSFVLSSRFLRVAMLGLSIASLIAFAIGAWRAADTLSGTMAIPA